MEYISELISKSASCSPNSRKQCQDIMDQIYKENPSYWPNGCHAEGHDDLYLVREASTKEPVGFVGWQERRKGKKRVGYYTIGILPEYRGQKLAKEAVSRVVQEKAASVDQVLAFIVPTNAPSLALAKSLDIPVVKEASSWKKELFKDVSKAGLAGVTGAGLTDILGHGDRSFVPGFGDWSNMDRHRGAEAAFNAVGWGAAPSLMKAWGPAKGLLASTSLPLLKMVGLGGLREHGDLASAMQQLATSQNQSPTPWYKDPKTLIPAITSGGVGLGVLAMLMRQSRREDPFATGKVQLRLPTRNPHDVETMVEVPMSQVGLSPNLYSSIGRDTRRKLREESKERIWRRNQKGNTSATHAEPISEDEAKAMEEELMKTSSYSKLPVADRLRRTVSLFLKSPF